MQKVYFPNRTRRTWFYSLPRSLSLVKKCRANALGPTLHTKFDTAFALIETVKAEANKSNATVDALYQMKEQIRIADPCSDKDIPDIPRPMFNSVKMMTERGLLPW